MVEFNQMWFIFQHTSSICVAVLGFPWYRSSHPDPWKSPQLQIYVTSSSVRYCFPAFGLEVFFHVGEQKKVRWYQIRRMWRVINKSKATVTHSSHCNHRLVCRRIVLVKQDSLCQFSTPLSSTTFQSPELLIQCGFIWKETMQLTSGKVEFNACQVSLLWHNSFFIL